MHFLFHLLADAGLHNAGGGESVGALGLLVFVDRRMDHPTVRKFDIKGGVCFAFIEHSSQMEDAVKNCLCDRSTIIKSSQTGAVSFHGAAESAHVLLP